MKFKLRRAPVLTSAECWLFCVSLTVLLNYIVMIQYDRDIEYIQYMCEYRTAAGGLAGCSLYT